MKIGISIDVDDLERAIDFYTRGMGLSVVERGPDWAHLTHEGQTIFIMQLPDGSDVNAWMVRQGWAVAYYSATYRPEESAAHAAKRGIWAGSFMLPSEWRHRHLF